MQNLRARIALAFLLFVIVNADFKNNYYYEGSQRIGASEDFFQFRSRPDLLAPRWNITKYDDKALSLGYLFVAPYMVLDIDERGEAWIGPHIYTQDGELVWSGAPLVDHYKGFDTRLASYHGADMMTIMYPHENSAFIVDKHYHIVNQIVHSSEWKYSNMHDFNVVEDGRRALVLTKNPDITISRDRSMAAWAYDGECHVRQDGFKYLDITVKPPRILLEWNGIDHIELNEFQMNLDTHNAKYYCSDRDKLDLHHLNSIDIFPDGDILVSSRNTGTLFKVSNQTGEIVWRIGGHKSDFRLTENATFYAQHHARVLVQNETHIVITLVDNSKDIPDDGDLYLPRVHSAGLILSLDILRMEGEALGIYLMPHGRHIRSRGSAHLQSNGNMFMGWAENVLIAEYAHDGRLLMEAHVVPTLDSYRSYKFHWLGEPLDPPDVVSAAFVSGNTTYTMAAASWNGATEVMQWKLYEYFVGDGSQTLLLTVPKNGFETTMTVQAYAKSVVVEAIDIRGRPLGRSRAIRTVPPAGFSVKPRPSGHPSEWSPSLDGEQSKGVLNQTIDDPSNSKGSTTNFSLEPEQQDWSSSIDVTQVVTIISGFLACASIIAIIYLVRN